MLYSSRATTPQSAPPMSTRRKQTSVTEPAPVPAPVSTETVTPKRGRKPTKTATPTEQPPEKQPPVHDRPVQIALSSHLVRILYNSFVCI